MEYTTEIIVKIQIKNQMGVKSAIRTVEESLNYPCFTHLDIVSIRSDFNPHGLPLKEMIDVDI